MKIVIFAPYFYPNVGGMEQYCLEIASRLSKIGHQITVVTSKTRDEETPDKLGLIHIIRLDSYNLLNGTFPVPALSLRNSKLLRNLFRNHPDAIITNTRFFPLTTIALVYSKFYRIKSFHIEHGTSYPCLKNPFTRLAAKVYDNTFGRLVFFLSTKHLAVSEAAARFSRILGGRQITVIYNSIDPYLFSAGLHKEENKETNKTTKIIFAGRLIEAKGVQDLIAAVQMIHDLPLVLTIVGKGNYRQELEKLAGEDGRIHFLGEKKRDELIRLLGKSDIFINPSYSEGLPTSVIEAGAAGVPVIATNVGGTNEVIDDNVNGYLVLPHLPSAIAEKIRMFALHPYISTDFSQKLRTKVLEKFNWELTIGDLEKILG